jgi:hypothetical protein
VSLSTVSVASKYGIPNLFLGLSEVSSSAATLSAFLVLEASSFELASLSVSYKAIINLSM